MPETELSRYCYSSGTGAGGKLLYFSEEEVRERKRAGRLDYSQTVRPSHLLSLSPSNSQAGVQQQLEIFGCCLCAWAMVISKLQIQTGKKDG